MLFPTTLVGSYPQPDWLIDRKRLTEYLQKIVDEQTIGRGIHPGMSGKAGPAEPQ